MNTLQGIRDLVPFLNFLKENKVWFHLEHVNHEALMVTITLVGERIEIEFFDDHIEFSRFTGDESVERDVGLLFGLIADFLRE
jgi:hypothetical protein